MKSFSKQKTQSQLRESNIITTKSFSNEETKCSTARSFIKKRGIKTDILDDSTISPLYTGKASFGQFQTENYFLSEGMLKHRLSSRNKHRSKIKKEIDNLSRSFRESTCVQCHMNRPIISVNKPKYNQFNINYASLISLIKENSKENRRKNKNANAYISYPNSNLFLRNNLKYEEPFVINKCLVNDKRQNKAKSPIAGALKTDLDSLYILYKKHKEKAINNHQ